MPCRRRACGGAFAALLEAALAGAGRAAASAVDPAGPVAGFHVPICHSGPGDSPVAPTSHDCCDDCALMAPAVLPAPPALAKPLAPAAAAEHGGPVVDFASPSRLGPAGDATLVLPVLGPLAPGAYKVNWHALATDGHKTEGSFPFTVTP